MAQDRFPFIALLDQTKDPASPQHEIEWYETLPTPAQAGTTQIYVEWEAVKELLTKMAKMHREGTEKDELACQRGIESDATYLFTSDFFDAAILVWGQETNPEGETLTNGIAARIDSVPSAPMPDYRTELSVPAAPVLLHDHQKTGAACRACILEGVNIVSAGEHLRGGV